MRCVIGGETYDYRDDIRRDEAVRRSFDALARRTFGLSFEGWYQGGYWQGDYLPHVLMRGDKVVANVSVNLCPMRLDGEPCRLVQLGTVMTDENFRGRGLARFLMERILETWASRCDGMYLYANDSVLGFYPKFDFVRAEEYRYELPLSGEKPSAVRLSMETAADVRALLNALTVWDIFGGDGLRLSDVLTAVAPEGTRRIRLGFTPTETEGMEAGPLREADTTLFVRGDIRAALAAERLMFPMLSHA